jgi:hypothetical protein
VDDIARAALGRLRLLIGLIRLLGLPSILPAFASSIDIFRWLAFENFRGDEPTWPAISE